MTIDEKEEFKVQGIKKSNHNLMIINIKQTILNKKKSFEDVTGK